MCICVFHIVYSVSSWSLAPIFCNAMPLWVDAKIPLTMAKEYIYIFSQWQSDTKTKLVSLQIENVCACVCFFCCFIFNWRNSKNGTLNSHFSNVVIRFSRLFASCSHSVRVYGCGLCRAADFPYICTYDISYYSVDNVLYPCQANLSVCRVEFFSNDCENTSHIQQSFAFCHSKSN